MDSKYIIDSLSYLDCSLAIGLLAYLLIRGQGKRLWELVFYLVASLSVGAARFYSLRHYGVPSPQYSYCYWITDLLLVLAAFVVVSAFFRRASAENPKMWLHLRLLLGSVFFLLLAFSLVSLSHHNGEFLTAFIIEFQQDLYFATLVLNTLLYLLVVKLEIGDGQLGMLICGLGIEFAGPAACMALFYMTGGSQAARVLCSLLLPLCDIGMILTWFYATARVPGEAKAQGRVQARRVFVEENIFN